MTTDHILDSLLFMRFLTAEKRLTSAWSCAFSPSSALSLSCSCIAWLCSALCCPSNKACCNNRHISYFTLAPNNIHRHIAPYTRYVYSFCLTLNNYGKLWNGAEGVCCCLQVCLQFMKWAASAKGLTTTSKMWMKHQTQRTPPPQILWYDRRNAIIPGIL